MNRVFLLGTGSELPGEPVSNEELLAFADFGPKATAEWMSTKLGIQTRHIARHHVKHATPPRKGMECSSLAARAATKALDDANVDKSSVDLILVASCTPDYIIPSTATLVQEKLDIAECAAIDVRAACSGFTQAVTIAQNFLKTGYYKVVLVIGAEVTSTTGNLDLSLPGACSSDRVNASMMGDGAAAFVLRGLSEAEVSEGTPPGPELVYTSIKSIGVGQSPGIYMPAGGSLMPFCQEVLDRGDHFHKQDFRRVLAHGAELYVRGINDALNFLNISLVDVDLVVPHQANGKLREIGKPLGFNPDRIFMNFEKLGNTANASLPLCIDEIARADDMADDSIVVAVAAESTKWLYGTMAFRWHPRDTSVTRARIAAPSFASRLYTGLVWSTVSSLQSIKRAVGL